MKVTIFLDIEEVFRLSQLVPVKSSAGAALGLAINAQQYCCLGYREIAIECDDTEARELFGYADANWPSTADKIRQAFRSAHISRIDDEYHDVLTTYAALTKGDT